MRVLWWTHDFWPSIGGAEVIGAMNGTGRFAVTADAARLGEADALLICVPTPLTRHR